MTMVRAVIAGILLGLMLASPVQANHSLWNPRQWWDLDQDKIPDPEDSRIGYQRVGALWTVEKINDIGWVFGEWRGRSRWNPFSATDQGGVARATYRVDGVHPCGKPWPQQAAGEVCVTKDPRFEAGQLAFYDIRDVDTGINLAIPWNYGNDVPADNQADFRSNGVHEVGHGLSLKDLVFQVDDCLTPVVSMCTALGTGMPAGTRKTLEADDISAANVVYPFE